MYNAQITKIPASWALAPGVHENTADGEAGVANGTSGYGPNGTNSRTNGTSAALPESFLESKAVKTVYGLVPLKHALDWPVFASYDELAGCAAWMGGRIPTFEEARSIYAHVEVSKKKEAEKQLGKTVPAVNGQVTRILLHNISLPLTHAAATSVTTV